ncbi:MAG TPA: SHOCT domain-containing protein [Candidatus Didemnitutus sp.]|nr:SHOCT domain-containing protein [Candidatus Didemnitutus sp.]
MNYCIIGLAAVVAILSACANPEIVSISPDTYLLARTDHGGIFGNESALKAGVYRDAAAFAAKQGKVMVPLTFHSSPMFPGHFANCELQFRVVDKEDPEAKRTTMVDRLDKVVERHDSVDVKIDTGDKGKDSAKPFDLYTEITKLDELRKKGLITDAEFEAQKKVLLEKAK